MLVQIQTQLNDAPTSIEDTGCSSTGSDIDVADVGSSAASASPLVWVVSSGASTRGCGVASVGVSIVLDVGGFSALAFCSLSQDFMVLRAALLALTVLSLKGEWPHSGHLLSAA